MSTVSVELSTEEAGYLLYVLPLLSPTAALGAQIDPGKKALSRLVRKIQTQFNKAQAAEAARADQILCIAEYESLTKLVLDVLPTIKRRGLTTAAVNYIEEVADVFNLSEQNVKSATKDYAITLPRSERSSAELPSTLLTKELETPRRRLDFVAKKYLAAESEPLLASSEFNLSSKRQTLAKKCLRTAIDQGEAAVAWSEMEHIALAFRDMSHHIQLAKALIVGCPSQIEDVLNRMGVDSQDMMDSSVCIFFEDMNGLHRIKSAPKPKR